MTRRFVATIHVLLPEEGLKSTADACDYMAETLRPLFSDWAYVSDADTCVEGIPVCIQHDDDASEGEFVSEIQTECT